MSDGAPCEQGVGQVRSASLLGREVPGGVPSDGETQIGSKKERRVRYQRGRQRRQKAAASAGKVRTRVDRGRSMKVVCAEMDDFRHTMRAMSKGLDLSERSLRAEVSEVRQGAEAAVAAANVRVDALEMAIKEGRGNKLPAGSCASEESGVADAVGGVVCDCSGGSRNGAELVTAHCAMVQHSTPTVRDGVMVDDVSGGTVHGDHRSSCGWRLHAGSW